MRFRKGQMKNACLGMIVSCLVHGGLGLGIWGLSLVVQGDTPSIMLDLTLLPAAAPDAVAEAAAPPPPATAKAAPRPPEVPQPQAAVPPLSSVPVPEPPRPAVAVVPVALPPPPVVSVPAVAVVPVPKPVAASAPAVAAPAGMPAAASGPAPVASSAGVADAALPVPEGVSGGVSREDYAQIAARLRRYMSYPNRAREMGWEGRVLVAFRLKADGAAENIRVVSSSGHRLLDDSAIAAVQRAAPFPPPGRDGELTCPVLYSLH